MSYRKYGDYREPVGSWLGEIPSSWEIQRVKAALLLRKTSVGRFASKHVLLSLTLKGVIERDLGGGGKFPADFSTYQLVELDDLVFCLFDIDETPRTVGIARGDGMITGAYSVYRCRGANVPHFLSYYFLHLDSFKGLRPFYTGLRKVVRADTFSKIEIPLPSVDEQRNIAAFLDHETARIDALIEKQQQLIALLKEKRQAVISHAVTKGLNPDAPMRDSGVEWLGDVPEHWTVCRIKQVAELDSGHTPSKAVPEYWENCTIPWVSLNDTRQLKQTDRITETAVMISESGMANSSAHLLPAGCVVFTRDATIGLAAITMTPMAVSQHLIAWICDPTRVLSEYLLLVIYGMEGELERFTFGATLKTIGMPDVKRLVGAFPPLDEQRSIVKNVQRRRARLAESIARSERLLELLGERRSALISAAVTGKIDVRGWTTPVAEAVVA